VRAALILAVLLPLAVLVAYVLARAHLRGRRSLRRIDELERENQRLDDLLAGRSEDPARKER
jgi:hypothetical protein